MHKSLFGTDGIRSAMGTEPLRPTTLMRLGHALGYWILHELKVKNVLIAHDTRLSSPLVKTALKTGLLEHALHITDAGVLPTPTVFYSVTNEPFDVALMITASHNQYQDNGIKIITKQYGKSTPEQEKEISRLFYELPECVSYENLGTEETHFALSLLYTDALKKIFPAQFLKDTRIVLDCAHGAYFSIAPKLLRDFGADVISLADSPTGKNINANCGSQYPERLQAAVKEHAADIGFAFDGDGDRVIMVDKRGAVHDGDDLLALLLEHPSYHHQTRVVGTLMTNFGFEQHITQHDVQLVRTDVGDKNVLRCMKQEHCVLGGEPSGHVILRDFGDTSDGLFTCLRVLETCLYKKTWTPEFFKKFPQISINVPVHVKRDLATSPYAQVISKHQEALQTGRLIVRYSGTEPVLRVMVEDLDQDKAATVGALLSQELADTLAKEQE